MNKMEYNTLINDFGCLSFFKNVIQNKLKEADQHLHKLEMYKLYPDLFSLYTLNDIIEIHEEHSDFIGIVYQQCRAWREQALDLQQHEQVNQLEKITKRLETTIYHITYVAEQIKKSQEISMREEGEDGCTEVNYDA